MERWLIRSISWIKGSGSQTPDDDSQTNSRKAVYFKENSSKRLWWKDCYYLVTIQQWIEGDWGDKETIEDEYIKSRKYHT